MIAPLLLGLLSSLHCVGMCGPIVLALPVHTMNKRQKVWSVMLYHLGRIFTYSLLGFLFGSLGKGLFIAGFQQKLSIILGILMIAVVLFFHKKIFNNQWLSMPFLYGKIKQKFGIYLRKKNTLSFFMIGLLNGLLPCAMIYMALFGATSTQGAWYGALFMALYGLGTIPLLNVVAWIGIKIGDIQKKKLQKIIPFFLFLMGVFLIIRGLGLDIPYLSPTKLQLFITGNPQCF